MHRTHHTPVDRGRDERGQAALLVVVVSAVLFVSILVALTTTGTTVLEHQRAQTAADAAALASLDGGRAAAVDLAERHGASVVSWRVGPGPGEVTVVVRLGTASATA